MLLSSYEAKARGFDAFLREGPVGPEAVDPHGMGIAYDYSSRCKYWQWLASSMDRETVEAELAEADEIVSSAYED